MNPTPSPRALRRREFLHAAAAAGTGALAARSLAATEPTSKPSIPTLAPGKAEACIFLWLGGGAAHTDTWDPKRLGDPATRKAGSAYPSVETSVPGVRVCQHLANVGGLAEHFTILRGVHHEVIDEHAAAVNHLYTGRPVSGTIVYPSLGSVVSHERGPAAEGMPAYVLAGYPTLARGPGFLGPAHRFFYTTDTSQGPAGLARPAAISSARMDRRRQLQERVRNAALKKAHPENEALRGYDGLVDAAHALAQGDFRTAFELDREPAALRQRYGGEFGQRCLLARRLVERGVRFVEVLHNLTFANGTGWDTHNDGQLNQHVLIAEVDAALATLIEDLRERKTLDRTLIVVASEFGRPITFDSGGGRGHQASAFSVLLAGGGLTHHGALGETDEDGKKPESHPVSIPDLHATLYHALGIDPARELHAGDRPVPITDGGRPVPELF